MFVNSSVILRFDNFCTIDHVSFSHMIGHMVVAYFATPWSLFRRVSITLLFVYLRFQWG